MKFSETFKEWGFGGVGIWANLLVTIIVGYFTIGYMIAALLGYPQIGTEQTLHMNLLATSLIFIVLPAPITFILKLIANKLVTFGKAGEIFRDALLASIYSTVIIGIGLVLIIDCVGFLGLVFPGDLGLFFRNFGGWDHFQGPKGLFAGSTFLFGVICPAIIVFDTMVYYKRWTRTTPSLYPNPLPKAFLIGLVGSPWFSLIFVGVM